MSERIDRGIGGNRWVLWTLAALLAAGAGVFAWQRMSAPARPQTAPAPAAQAARPDEPLAVTLYYPADGMLAAAPAGVVRQASTQALAREALAALLAESHAAQSAVIRGLRLRAFFLDAAGTGYVDLAVVQPGGAKVSAQDELLALYAMVNVLTQNFEEIRRVRFLLEGRETQTLAGHIDLSGAFEKRMDLVKQ